MLFNSAVFILFAALFFAVWPWVRKVPRARWTWLVFASAVFYGWWDAKFLLLILFSGLVDYVAALGMRRWPSRKKLLLWASIAANVGSLATFKYLDLIAASLTSIFGWVGWSTTVPPAGLALPVGISFYTFQSMSYTIDVYRGKLEPTRDVLHFFAYLMMFPQLVAGPIVRASRLLPQLNTAGRWHRGQITSGLRLIAMGFAKKMLLADNMARGVNRAYDHVDTIQSGGMWWLVAAMFACQIYGDFSGYSNIARGLARWMGYEFPRNFNTPYAAIGFRDFWARWHISLSTWFRDYVYIPLGGSRGSAARVTGNLWITMLVSGLWHGAAWTFVVWGALHALLLSIERITRWPVYLAKSTLGRWLGWCITLVLMLISWVFFRASSIDEAFSIVGMMFINLTVPDASGIGEAIFDPKPLVLLGLFALTTLAAFVGARHWRVWRHPLVRRSEPIWIAALIVAAVLLRGPGQKFIYFQF